jgi:hypothetical protein
MNCVHVVTLLHNDVAIVLILASGERLTCPSPSNMKKQITDFLIRNDYIEDSLRRQLCQEE